MQCQLDRDIKKIYLIGSLRNPDIGTIGNLIRELGYDVFDDWKAAGPEADDYWQAYEVARGHNFRDALSGHAARHVYAFDRLHLSTSNGVVMALPAGRSGHLEFGWAIGQGKPGWILMPGEPDRFDVMYQFATGIAYNMDELAEMMRIEFGA